MAKLSWGAAALWLGLALLAVPTLVANAHQSWATEQGEQAPLVLAIGIWLLFREWPHMRRAASPGSLAWSAAFFVTAGLIYLLGRVSDQFEVESYGLYGLGLAGIYATVGASGLARGWFPVAYLIFALPPPYTLSWFLTVHLRLLITEASVGIFRAMGFSIVRDGLNILIDQYNIAVQDACSGMNSLFSLSAIGLVYLYLRRGSTWWYLALMIPPIIVFAIVGNLARVVAVIGLTHYFGDAVAQGYLHESAGLLVFLVALLGVVGVDFMAARFAFKKGGRVEPAR